jgi:hypothetical protein
MRDFVDRTVAEMDRVPGLLRGKGDEVVVIELRLTLDVDDGIVSEFGREMDRLGHLGPARGTNISASSA